MLKEKLNKIFKNDGNNKKKTENLVFLLIILIVTVVAINTIWKDAGKDRDATNIDNKKLAINVEEKEIKSDSLEEKLEYILSNISGVGNVDVLITYNETEEIIPVYNKSDKKSVTSETDSKGGLRTIEETDTSSEVIYQNDEIIVQKTISPKIEGAIITATGANNANVKANIIQAVEAATGLATHKIQVFEKKN